MNRCMLNFNESFFTIMPQSVQKLIKPSIQNAARAVHNYRFILYDPQYRYITYGSIKLRTTSVPLGQSVPFIEDSISVLGTYNLLT